jgi:hypothetical protein
MDENIQSDRPEKTKRTPIRSITSKKPKKKKSRYKRVLPENRKKRGRPPKPNREQLTVFEACEEGYEEAARKFSEIEIKGATNVDGRDSCVEIAIDRLFFLALKRLAEHCMSKNEQVSVRACAKVCDLRVAMIRGRKANFRIALEGDGEEMEGGWSF